MLRLRSLICGGCENAGSSNSFYDIESKRPLFLQCGHPMCSDCVSKYETCPICRQEVVQMENFAARQLYEDMKNKPIEKVFKSWFKAKGDEEELCSNCHEPSRKLRLCITCELSLRNLTIEHVKRDGREWKDFGQRDEALRRFKENEEKMKKAYRVNLVPLQLPDENEYRPRFRCEYYILANRLICSNCILNYHNDHVRKTLQELEYDEVRMKQLSSLIATSFIWTELRAKKGKCLIQTMRMHRTCEKLAHLAMYYYPNPNAVIRCFELHDRFPTYLNKFFESLGRKNLDGTPIDRGDDWIESLEHQERLEDQESCECGGVWEEMHNRHFGNQIQKKFIEIIEGLGNRKISKCPLTSDDFRESRNKAIELSKTNIFKVYTAFCWNHKNDKTRCLFDNFNRKPCICRHCKVSTCMDCLKQNANFICIHCGSPFFDLGLGKTLEYNVDDKVLELVAFFKKNCVEILEKWWTCEPSELGFCLSCSSYSDSLEVCVFCELTRRGKALRTTPRKDLWVQYRQSMPLHFNYANLHSFPIRWQCDDCKKRLEANWSHKYCGDSRSETWKGTWNRGCNHLLTRVYSTKTCSSYDLNADICEYNSIKLRDVGYYDLAMKVVTMGFVFQIVKAAIEEEVKCRVKRAKLLSIYGMLNKETRYYFKNSMSRKGLEDGDQMRVKINQGIQQLKKEWTTFRDSQCLCSEVWNEANDSVKKRMKKNINGIRCPLSFEILEGEGEDECDSNEELGFHQITM